MKLLWPDYRPNPITHHVIPKVFIRSDRNFISRFIFMFEEYFSHSCCGLSYLNVKFVWHKQCKQRVDRPLSLVLKNKIRQSAPPKLKMCCVFCFMVWYGNSNVQGQLFILRAG